MAPTSRQDDERAGSGINLPWAQSERPVPRIVLRPLQAYLQTSSASAVVLLLAVIVAIVWANSPWRDAYERLWTTPISLHVGARHISEDLRHAVTDGLMALFFVVVGLEIKRELVTGELQHWRAASVPIIGAIGGMVVPALIYVGVNRGTTDVRGWGVPMATDIAIALAVLTLAARHAPTDLRPFLLTLAIVDDIGAIVIIALFYSEGVEWPAIAAAVVIILAIVGLQRIHVRATAVYLVLGTCLWFAMFESGVQATLAGVILGLLTPVRPFQRPRHVSEEARRTADETVDDPVLPTRTPTPGCDSRGCPGRLCPPSRGSSTRSCHGRASSSCRCSLWRTRGSDSLRASCEMRWGAASPSGSSSGWSSERWSACGGLRRSPGERATDPSRPEPPPEIWWG